MTAPCIGITKPEHGDNAAYAAIKLAVRLAGGRAQKMAPGMSWRRHRIDGLILGGGSDVFPEFYDAEAVEDAQYDRGRDEMEMYWARKARENDLPVLGICRGAQLLNVAHGGTLHQDLSSYDNADYPSSFLGHAFYRKKVEIEPGSLMHDIFGVGETRVNSIHKQAIDRPGKGLRVTAREANGVIQAVEDPARRFCLGVQFHPEFLLYRADSRRIFQRLVEEARNHPVAAAHYREPRRTASQGH